MLARVWACFMLEREKEGGRESEKEIRMRACFMLARMRTPSSPVRERDVEYVQNCYFYF
jgi:hypothetical protein